MEVLDLSNNGLSGPIPPELGNLSGLAVLNLSNNGVSGPIPPELGNLPVLRELVLYDNLLNGTIPPELGNLSNAMYVILGRNELSGSIPPELGNLSGLEDLSLESNLLSGPIPVELGNLNALRFLSTGYNMLFADDPATASFIDDITPNWTATQTIPPANVATARLSPHTAQVSWTPIPYTGDGGHYEILYSDTPGGPYMIAGNTADKSSDVFHLDNLKPNTAYYVVIATFTPAHISNANDLYSNFSEEVQVAKKKN